MEQIIHYINEIKSIQDDMRKLFYQDDETLNKNIISNECQLPDNNDIIDILECMNEYINENPKLISESDFHHIFLQDMNTIFPCCEIIEEIIDLFHILFFPKRSENPEEEKETEEETEEESEEEKESEEEEESEEEKEDIKHKINYLHSQPQHTQRTPAWYDFRNNLITASNAYKIFETKATRNQIIYEKCIAFTKRETNIEDIATPHINTESPLHWGQKYEPVSVLMYEKMSETKIEEFGCIKHSKYDFLGASPDGIITDPASPKYGRMLEIKNIVNREIDGIPKKEYWIQMQLQMEVCDLNECDFLETQFIEYENEQDFLHDYEIDSDSEAHFTETSNGDLKGIIMYFSKEGIPTYIYKPLDMNKTEFDVFENEKMEATELTWIKNIYWKLKTSSCVLVKRNRRWFQDNISEIQDIWNIIKRERINDYSHRAPTKRKSSINTPSENKCLISINGGKTIIV
jgi:putative phage-type endonuclease